MNQKAMNGNLHLEKYLIDADLEIYNSLQKEESQAQYLGEKVIKGNFSFLVDILGYRDTGEFHKEQMEKLKSILEKYINKVEIR